LCSLHSTGLRRRGIGRESKVVLHLRRGHAVFDWILAVLKAGAAFVYLDPDFAEEQKRKVLANAEPDLIIDERQAEELLTTQSPETDDNNLAATKYGTADADLAYLIYTSGSTGEPKGVMIEHGSIAHFVRATTDVFKVGFGARVLQFAPLSFDASIMEWTAALCSGATLCLAEHPKQLVGEYLADVLEQNEVSWLQTTPTALGTLPLNRDYAKLRQIVAGGEAPSRDVLQRWHARVDLVNAYGPTEAAIGVSFNPIAREEKMADVISAGRPTPTTSIHICAQGFGPVLQPGFQGEICLAGPQLARGYCQQPELTAKSFATHANGRRMYRTGDKGMLLEDGSVVVQGRMDRELKIRGQRIAPEEVEKAIANADVGVLEASVQGSADSMELVAVVAPDTISTRSLAAGLRRLLPAYKVPTKMFLRRSLPKNTSGKIDHKAVRQSLYDDKGNEVDDSAGLSSSSGDDEKAVMLPRVAAGQNEDLVQQIWQALLGTSEKLPVDVNFFDIGGHSLLVPKLYQRLKDAFPGTAVRLVDLFHQSTIKQQAVLFGGNASRSANVNIRPSVSPASSRRKVKTRSMKSSSSSPTPTASLSKTSSSRSSLASMSMAEPETPATSIAFLDERPEVAVVGVAGRFPQAKSADEFYRRLLDEKYLGIVPSQFKKEALPGNVWVPKAGMLDDVEDFDHAFWHLSKEEATDMDPQQRLFLEVAYEALTDAGVDLSSLNGGRTGIFVGSANGSYHQHTESVVSDPFLRENRASIAPSISARTAYHLNISGPNVTIQVNCASSTVALSQAAGLPLSQTT
jgi:amino acid adenylation domain-containing protein